MDGAVERESAGLRRNELEEGGPRERTGRTASVCCGLCGFGRCATVIGRRGDGTPASMPRYDGHLDLRVHETGDGPLDIPEQTSTETHALPRDGLAFPGDRCEGEPAARGSRQWATVLHRRRGGAVAGVQRAAQSGRQNARRAGGALKRGRSIFQPVNPTLTACFSKN
jgi:hypothetical protein